MYVSMASVFLLCMASLKLKVTLLHAETRLILNSIIANFITHTEAFQNLLNKPYLKICELQINLYVFVLGNIEIYYAK